MARWKLMTSHYLNLVIPAEWEFSAVQGGKSVRRRFPVPTYLDIRDPGQWTTSFSNGKPTAFGGNNDDAEGEIIVCHKGRGEPSDIAFVGDPTPDMMPIDDEAKAISDSFEAHWSYKPDTAEMSFSQSLVDTLESVLSKTPEPAKTATDPALLEVLASLAKGQAAIAEALSVRR